MRTLAAKVGDRGSASGREREKLHRLMGTESLSHTAERGDWRAHGQVVWPASLAQARLAVGTQSWQTCGLSSAKPSWVKSWVKPFCGTVQYQVVVFVV